MDRIDLEAAALRLAASLDCLAQMSGNTTADQGVDLPREGLASLFDLLARQSRDIASGVQSLKF